MSAKKYFMILSDIGNPIGYTCGGSISEVYAGTIYYTHPRYIIGIYTGTVTLNVDSVVRPNRFTLYVNGSFYASSGWLGTASYAGPWGATLSASPTASISYSPTSGNLYELAVEVGNADSGSPVTDTFNVAIVCT